MRRHRVPAACALRRNSSHEKGPISLLVPVEWLRTTGELMIRQLLDPEFLLQSRAELQKALSVQTAKAEQGDPDTLRELDREQVSLDDLRAASAHLAASATQEAIDDQQNAAALPRDAFASLLQSNLQRFYEERKPELIERTSAQGAFAHDVPVTDTSLTPAAAQLKPQKLFEAMSQTDVRWASVGYAKLVELLRHKHDFPDRPAASLHISNNARVFLVGDWGSGVPRARAVGQRMRALLTEPAFQNVEQHVIHLGDVYYSGFKREYDKNFLPDWPVHPGEDARYGSWCLNGNHDMYSGGHAYFDFLLSDPRFVRQNRSSHFLLENDYWQMFALDTAWEDAGLAGDQAKWVSDTRRANSQKKGIMLSHHQLFSPYEGGSEKLQKKLAPYRVIRRRPSGCLVLGARTPLRTLRASRWDSLPTSHRTRRSTGLG